VTYSLALVLLSGPVASGKTTLASNLERLLSAAQISTSGLIAASISGETDRAELQRLGLSTRYRGAGWIIEAIRQNADRDPAGGVIVVDAVRTIEQSQEIRRAAAGTWRVLHVHLHGNQRQLGERHEQRHRPRDLEWDEAVRSPAEAEVPALEAEADVVIDTTRDTPTDVAARVAARVRRFPPHQAEYVDALVGGQWGSEGKGNLAFFLAPEYDLLVRVGAPNAGHKICTPDGHVYTHRQLPSGTQAGDSLLLLGAGAVIDPAVLMREISDCGVSSDRLAIDPRALIIEDIDVRQETRLKGSIGSTGTGGGAALARRIEQRGVPGAVRMASDLPELAPYVRESGAVFTAAQARGGRIFAEGTQGTDLSIVHGSYPHVTSRDTTVGTLLGEIGLPPKLLRRVIVAFRTYPIRVGGPSGPMGQEITWNTVARRSGLPASDLSEVERGSVSGNPRRVAEFSWAQLRHSAQLNGATDLALTFADYIDARNRHARQVSQLTQETVGFVGEMEAIAATPVSLISAGFDGRGPIDRRLW
jgi:adenylosuccinate synthase